MEEANHVDFLVCDFQWHIFQCSCIMDLSIHNEKPIEGSQYWVAPCIVEYMEKNFPKIDKGLLQYIEDNNDYGMKFCACDYE